MKKNYILLTIAVILLVSIIDLMFPNVAYAMGTEELVNIDYNACLRDETMCPKRKCENNINPVDYWKNNPHQNDAYAINQKNIHLYNNPHYRIERLDYPIKSEASLKSKLFWFIWKKHTNQFDDCSHFEESLNKSFSVRSELYKDIKRIFKK